MRNDQFCHLHTHNEYSQLDGVGKAQQYAEEAKKLGFKYLGLTNHGNVDGVIRWQQACSRAEIVPILGTELYLVPNLKIKEKGEKRYHILLLAKGQEGFESIQKMITIANIDGHYYRPRIDPAVLLENTSDSLVVMTACTSSFLNMPGGERLLLQLNEVTKGQTYLEVMPHEMEEQKALNRRVIELSDKHSINIVASIDCHYPRADQAKAQEVLLAIQSKKKWHDPTRWKFSVGNLYLQSADELLQNFLSQGILSRRQAYAAMTTSLEIASLCSDFQLKPLPVDLPKVPGFEDRDETELLKGVIADGTVTRLEGFSQDKLRQYQERADEEFGLICELGFQRYFLIVWELISWCKKNDIMVGPGRGSVGGSLVAYLMGITDVDPIKYDLVFARFISPARIDLPDIDMDFEDIKRDKVRQHLEDSYGKSSVAGVSTYLKMKGRAALRDVGRVFDVPSTDLDKAAKSIVVRSGGDLRADFTIADAFDTFEDGIAFKQKYPEVTKMAIDLEGQIRGSGQHAAAMCISKEDLRSGKRCCLMHNPKKQLIVNWDKNDAEFMGLMKLDVLGLSALTVLNHTRKLANLQHRDKIRFDKLPLDDREVLADISAGHNVGVFQLGSMGLMKYCRELGIESFEDIVMATSLWRPGTLRSGMTSEFTLRKRGESESNTHPALAKITKNTQGIILFQEQVMQLMYDLAGLPWRTCDIIRKVISKSQGDELFMKVQEQFVEGCAKKGTLKKEEAEKVWNNLRSFGSYGFNRSHAVEYSMISYWDAWCKHYYPAEFMCASLTFGSQDQVSKAALIEEAKRLGLKVKLPKIGRSHAAEWATDGKEIYAPFSEIKGIGPRLAAQIAAVGRSPSRQHGFFSQGRVEISRAVDSILSAVGANSTDKDFTDEEIGAVSLQYFNFDLSDNPMRKFKGIYDKLLKKDQIGSLADIRFGEDSKKSILYFGTMTDLKFGYRQNVLKAARDEKSKGIGEVRGIATNLGGVYGFFKDLTDNCMMVFSSKVYQEKKNAVEHCEKEWILVRASQQSKASTIVCEDIWFEDDLSNCNLAGTDLQLIESKRFHDTSVLSCELCKLRSECKGPVKPSLGRTNAIILGEAPGREEDKEGKGFVGSSGDLLWELLAKMGYKRTDFHITNVVKCWPSTTKTPTKQQVKTCGERWLREEIQQLSSPLILALGNTSLQFLTGRESGITDLSGTTEWLPQWGAWVCYCMHPASVLYHQQNRPLLEKGLSNFTEKFVCLGGNNLTRRNNR